MLINNYYFFYQPSKENYSVKQLFYAFKTQGIEKSLLRFRVQFNTVGHTFFSTLQNCSESIEKIYLESLKSKLA